MKQCVSIGRSRVFATGLCLAAILAVCVTAGCKQDEGMSLLASAEYEGGLVAVVDSESGPLVWAGGSLYEFEDGSLSEVMGFSSDYSPRGMGTGSAPQPFSGGVVSAGDGRLVLVRGVPPSEVGDSEAVASGHFELVSVQVTGDRVVTDVVLSSPEILDFAGAPEVTGVDAICMCTDVDGAPVLSAASIAADGEVSEVWTRELAGRPAAWATGAGGAEVGVLVLGPGPTDVQLQVFDIASGDLKTIEMTQEYEYPAGLFAYGDGWLVEWWEDEGNRLTFVSGDSLVDLTGSAPENDHNQVLAIGDVSDETDGDEVVMNIGRVDSGERRAVLASLLQDGPTVLAELGSAPLSAAYVVDIDGDGQQDLVCVEVVDSPQEASHRSAARVGVWFADGAGGLQAPRYSGEYSVGIASVNCVDLDGDGVLEVLVGYETGSDDRYRVDALGVR